MLPITLALAAAFVSCTGSDEATEPPLRAERFWNLPRARGPAPESRGFELPPSSGHVLLFFDTRHETLLRDVVGPLNRLDARARWVVVGLTRDDPNAAGTLVYRHGIRFVVGARSPEHRRFGVQKLPCVLIRQGGSADRLVYDDIAGAIRELLSKDSASPAGVPATLPSAPCDLRPDTQVELLRHCALEAASADLRLAALEQARRGLPADQFGDLLAEAMVVEPPPGWNTTPFKRGLWCGRKLGSLGSEPDILSYRGWTVRVDASLNWATHVYASVSASASAADLVEQYLGHTGDNDAELLLRNVLLEKLAELPPEDVLPFMPTLLDAERDLTLRWWLIAHVADYLHRAPEHVTPELMAVLAQSSERDQHVAIRTMAQATLQDIAGRMP